MCTHRTFSFFNTFNFLIEYLYIRRVLLRGDFRTYKKKKKNLYYFNIVYDDSCDRVQFIISVVLYTILFRRRNIIAGIVFPGVIFVTLAYRHTVVKRLKKCSPALPPATTAPYRQPIKNYYQ